VESFSFGSELAAVSGFYAAKIAAARRSLNPRDIADAVRAIRDEQTLAVRAVTERWNAAKRAATGKRRAPKVPGETRASVCSEVGRQPS